MWHSVCTFNWNSHSKDVNRIEGRGGLYEYGLTFRNIEKAITPEINCCCVEHRDRNEDSLDPLMVFNRWRSNHLDIVSQMDIAVVGSSILSNSNLRGRERCS